MCLHDIEGDRIPSVLLRQAHVTDPHDQTISHKTYDLIRSFWGVRFQHMDGTIDFLHAIPSLTGEYLISDNVVFTYKTSTWPLLYAFYCELKFVPGLLYYVKSSNDFRVAVGEHPVTMTKHPR